MFMVPRRYGPPPKESGSSVGDDFDDDAAQAAWEAKDAVRVAEQRKGFTDLVEAVVVAESPEALPSLVTERMDLILSMRGHEGHRIVRDLLGEAEDSGDEERVTQIAAACDYVLTFAETFVQQAVDLDKRHKRLLGRIVEAATGKRLSDAGRTDVEDPSSSSSEVDREKRLDDLLRTERDDLTPGFLRHLEGECRRIEKAPNTTPESGRLLQTLRVVQTRVVEEMGKDLGEEAQVLGQLLGYEDPHERAAVLETGLTVRGVDFARRMLDLTKEALRGFKEDVPESQVDPELVERVEHLSARIAEFIDRSSSWD